MRCDFLKTLKLLLLLVLSTICGFLIFKLIINHIKPSNSPKDTSVASKTKNTEQSKYHYRKVFVTYETNGQKPNPQNNLPKQLELF